MADTASGDPYGVIAYSDELRKAGRRKNIRGTSKSYVASSLRKFVPCSMRLTPYGSPLAVSAMAPSSIRLEAECNKWIVHSRKDALHIVCLSVLFGLMGHLRSSVHIPAPTRALGTGVGYSVTKTVLSTSEQQSHKLVTIRNR